MKVSGVNQMAYFWSAKVISNFCPSKPDSGKPTLRYFESHLRFPLELTNRRDANRWPTGEIVAFNMRFNRIFFFFFLSSPFLDVAKIFEIIANNWSKYTIFFVLSFFFNSVLHFQILSRYFGNHFADIRIYRYFILSPQRSTIYI